MPMSSIGMVVTALCLKLSGRVSLFYTSGSLITNCLFFTDRYAGFEKHNVRLIIVL